jgi:hypothetical protein
MQGAPTGHFCYIASSSSRYIAHRERAWESDDMDDEQFVERLMAAIEEADVISLFFPLLRRALVVDARTSEGQPPLIAVMPQVSSVEERIAMIEARRPGLGKVRAVLAVPWIRPVRELEERRVVGVLVERLGRSGMAPEEARRRLEKAFGRLWSVEQLAFVSMIRGEGYQTIWAGPR